MSRILSLVFPFLLGRFALQAQVSLNWTARYAGPTNAQDASRAIAVDATGNSYVTGTTSEGHVPDIITIKHNSTGAPVWTNRWGAPALTEYPTDIEVDPDGGVYVYGLEWLTNGQVLVLLKYDATGTEQWVRRYGGLINNHPAQMALDLAGNNIYLTAVASQDNLSEFL